MKTQHTLHGMPYVPGVAVGTLHKGMAGAAAGHIVMCGQHEIESISTLPAGFIIIEAAPFSHVMIGLLGLGVPAVLISAQQAEMLEEGREYLLDGSSGKVTDATDTPYQDTTFNKKPDVIQPARMADGEPVNLCASVRQPAAVKMAKELGAKSIGLVRTEFLLPPDDQIPDAVFYQRVFRALCEAASPLQVTYRLLDVATDKIPRWMSEHISPDDLETYQGIRLYHIDRIHQVLQAQLDALAGLAGEYSIRILLPYITRLEEYDYWRSQVGARLHDAPTGAMLETPASVIEIDRLLQHADFVAVGCNDLMQNLYSADRDRPALRHYLDPYAPPLYRLLRETAERAGQKLEQVQLCGVLAQIQGVLPVLLGLGYRTFSLDTTFIPRLAEICTNTTRAECETIALQVCAAETTAEVRAILRLPADHHQPFLV